MLVQLEVFVVAAKAACYVGGGVKVSPSRQGAHDLTFAQGGFSYRDSYFGGADFIGQEVVWHRDHALWAMNYSGRILRPDLIDASQTGDIIKTALTAMYATGRFLGGFQFVQGTDIYSDSSTGDVGAFSGREDITRDGTVLYVLTYHGGLIRD